MLKKKEYPFYRKYSNGYLNFLGLYSLNELEENGVFRKFRALKMKKMIIDGRLWKKPVAVIVPIKENLKWREDFRSINKPLSSNYIYD